MVRKKREIVKLVVAKPLNDTEKRNLVTSFVTNGVNESVTDNDENNSSENVTSSNTKNVTENVNVNSTDIVTNNVTIEDTKSVTNNETTEVTNKDTKNVTKKVTKSVNIIKSITLGKKDIIAKFTSDKRVRPNYNLSEDTIELIILWLSFLGSLISFLLCLRPDLFNFAILCPPHIIAP